MKEYAPYRKDNLPDAQIWGTEIQAGPGRFPEIQLARRDWNVVAKTVGTASNRDLN